MRLSKNRNSVLAVLISDDSRLYKYTTYNKLQRLFYGNYENEFLIESYLYQKKVGKI
ncbi:MAG: hypothetical protein ACRC6U_00245 [Fusobacteriaceae bacterium]